MSVGFHAVSRAQVTDIDIVMVIGCGMIGMGAIVRSALRGATVIAVDLDDEKLELAKRIGAHHTINSMTENVHECLTKITEGLGPDVVIEAVGSPATYVMAVNEVGFTGRVVCIGYAKSEVSFQTKYFVRYMEQGTCPKNELISKVVKPEAAIQAMKEWAAAPGKVFRILVEFD